MCLSNWFRITIIFICNLYLPFNIEVAEYVIRHNWAKKGHLPFPSGSWGPVSDSTSPRAIPEEAVLWPRAAGLVSGDDVCID